MADYKWNGSTDENGVTRYSDGASIPNAQGNKDWRAYEVYVTEGGLTDPHMDSNELLEAERNLRLNEIPSEYVRRFEIVTGKTHKGADWETSNYSRILNKKIDGTATGNQLALLALVDELRDDVENIEEYLENAARTMAELENYDITDNSHWTTPV